MHLRMFLVLAVLVALIACSKEAMERFRGFRQPEGFPAPSYNLQNNEITAAGFFLGRKLFYDPLLSRNSTISCGSCHIQSSAFTQHGHDVSHGIDDRLGTRNSPPIMNLAWMPAFFWDGGVRDLDLQPVVPITNHVEMDETVANVMVKLRAHQDYPRLFRDAFGTEEITTARLMKALSQFMLMCISAESKYDDMIAGKVQFTPAESEGLVLFRSKCASCHAEPLFTDNSFRNNGIAIGPGNDEGRFIVTQDVNDRYKFKVPSLRNVAATAPFMHDGRFLTLEAVLDHYASGVHTTPNLDPSLQTGIALTTDEKSSIISFLRTLTDTKFLTDPLLAEQ